MKKCDNTLCIIQRSNAGNGCQTTDSNWDESSVDIYSFKVLQEL